MFKSEMKARVMNLELSQREAFEEIHYLQKENRRSARNHLFVGVAACYALYLALAISKGKQQ